MSITSLMANHYGTIFNPGGGSTGLTTGGAPVPEPVTCAILAAGALAILTRRRSA